MTNEQILERTIKNLSVGIANLQQVNAMLQAKLQLLNEEAEMIAQEEQEKEDEENA